MEALVITAKPGSQAILHALVLSCVFVSGLYPVLNVVGFLQVTCLRAVNTAAFFFMGLYLGTQQSGKMHPLQGLGRGVPESLQSLPEVSGIWPFASDSGLP